MIGRRQIFHQSGGYALIFFLTLIFTPSTLHAHNVVAGAYVSGMIIEGEIGLSNGETALPGVLVEVFDLNDKKIGETQIEADGLFTFTATTAQQHILKANLGAGHVAEIIVEAEEFATAQTLVKPTTKKAATPPASAATGISATELEAIVRKAVAQQVKPLQKELRAYKEKVMLRDITGGLGFILGIFGIAAWMATRKQNAYLQNNNPTRSVV